jgi:formate hydrogenlyase transcriptional activator
MEQDPVSVTIQAAEPTSLDLTLLQAIVEGTVQATCEDFFRALVSKLSEATGIENAFIAQFTKNSKTRVETLAYCKSGQIVANKAWDLEGTPCIEVIKGDVCHYPTAAGAKFPKHDPFESYLGVPLKDTNGDVLGHLAVWSLRAMPMQPQLLYILQIFAARAASELSRIHAIEQLYESEERFRDLFDEAPIAYVYEHLDSRFIRANKTAMRVLGITPEQVPTTVGKTFIPDIPDAQRRLKEAFDSIGRGADTSGVVLEMRRKDNGKPFWIQWWSRPDPSGLFTRTMFIDVTERVLMEQEQERLQAQNLYLQEELKTTHNFGDIVGDSVKIQSLLSNVARVATTDAPVLIQGESGTGKELIARAIHTASNRQDKPLIKVNCAALPAGLIESELFGHEKGAFTGAIAKRIGRFELAHGGTIFLDEIGEIPFDIQVKLLRVLQEQEFERVGGQASIKVDVRIIAATNRNLLQEIDNKTFREDLYYRLNVFPLTTPPLRERIEDIPLLVYFLIEKFAKRLGKKVEGISTKSLQRLKSYSWPGNIRELENVIERSMILSDSTMIEIDPELLVGSSEKVEEATQTTNSSLESVEKQHILAVLQKTNGVIEGPNGAAHMLDMHPSTLRYRMKKLSISKLRQ